MSDSHATRSYVAADGVRIAFYEWAPQPEAISGPPVVLQHGFAGSARANWVTFGCVEALVRAGRRAIAIDARGHGDSDKPHDPALHGEELMARDVIGVLDQLEVQSFDMVGYSMGGIIAMAVAAQDRRVRRLVLGGVGGRTVARVTKGGEPFSIPLAEALEAEDPTRVADPVAVGMRRFADAMGADRRALAALARSPRAVVALDRIAASTLLLVGDADPLAAEPELLAQAIAGAKLERLSGDHISVLGDRRYVPTLMSFLTDS